MVESPYRILIVDDEPGARAIIKRFLQESFPEMLFAEEASGVKDALNRIHKSKIDLLFLDVEMDDGTGFDLLDCLPELNFNVIFTTAHDDFAIKAFRYNAIDYLLKPIDPVDFIHAAKKAKAQQDLEVLHRRFGQLLITAKEKAFDKITLSTSTGFVFANTKDITRIETYGNYSFVYLAEGDRLLVSRNLKEFEEMLPQPDFFRIHQSHIINTFYVKEIIKKDGDHVVMSNGVNIPVSRRRKDDFMDIVMRR